MQLYNYNLLHCVKCNGRCEITENHTLTILSELSHFLFRALTYPLCDYARLRKNQSFGLLILILNKIYGDTLNL